MQRFYVKLNLRLKKGLIPSTNCLFSRSKQTKSTFLFSKATALCISNIIAIGTDNIYTNSVTTFKPLITFTLRLTTLGYLFSLSIRICFKDGIQYKLVKVVKRRRWFTYLFMVYLFVLTNASIDKDNLIKTFLCSLPAEYAMYKLYLCFHDAQTHLSADF